MTIYFPKVMCFLQMTLTGSLSGHHVQSCVLLPGSMLAPHHIPGIHRTQWPFTSLVLNIVLHPAPEPLGITCMVHPPFLSLASLFELDIRHFSSSYNPDLPYHNSSAPVKDISSDSLNKYIPKFGSSWHSSSTNLCKWKLTYLARSYNQEPETRL